jgi:hypothetical protein
MIDHNISPDQARLWASRLGQQASATNGPIAQGTHRPVHSAPLVHHPTFLDQLLQRVQAQQETSKNMRAQEFVAGV